MSYKPEDFPDHPGFAEAYNEMNRADRKKARKREKHEIPYTKEALQSIVDHNGKATEGADWFVKMPNDKLTGILVQAQHRLFAILAERRLHQKNTERYQELTEQIIEQNEKINFLQLVLGGS